MYKSLFDYQGALGSEEGKTWGPKGCAAPHLTERLSPGLSRHEFRVSLNGFRKYRIFALHKDLSAASERGLTHVQLYDGGVAEFLLSLWLSSRLPHLRFLFNFHWADQWLAFLSNRGFFSALRLRALISAARSAPANLSFSAETVPLAEHLRARLGIELHVYPIYSSYPESERKPWEDRDCDVLFLPQRPSELESVEQLSNELGARGIRVKVALKQETWERGGSPGGREKITFLPLPANLFQELFENARVVALPYDKPYFQWGSSGKFNEAICFGAFPFVPDWSAIASQSSGASRLHRLNFSDTKSSVQKIQARLQEGYPPGVKALYIRDFFEWLQQISRIPKAPENPAGHQFSALMLGITALIYRSPGRAATVRRRLGAACDFLIQRCARSWRRIINRRYRGRSASAGRF